MKASGRADPDVIDDFDGGVSWIAYPEEAMQRASHALVDGEDVWVVDPVDFDGLDELLDDHGTVRGVVLLLDRHMRDADEVARRHEVPVYVPDWMDGVESDLSAPVERLHRDLPDSEYGVHRVVDNALWQEAALYGEDSRTLVVAESVGTADFFLAGDERLGVHPARRLTPPNRLERLSPDRLLVGHGAGVFDGASEALADALDGSRRRAPWLYAKAAREFLL
jgi:hypothetical protein